MVKKKKGFTLIEVIAVIAILAITGALVFTLFNRTHKVFSKAEKESVSVDKARVVLSILEEDIRLSKEVKTSGLLENIKVQVNNKSDEVFSYSLESNKIIKYKGNTKIATLADNVKKFEVTPVGNSYKIQIGVSIYNLKVPTDDKEEIKSFETIVSRRIIDAPEEGAGGNYFGDYYPALILPTLDNIIINISKQDSNGKNFNINNVFMYQSKKYYDYLKGDENGLYDKSAPKDLDKSIKIPEFKFPEPQINLDFTKKYQLISSYSGDLILGNTKYSGGRYEKGQEGGYTIYYFDGNLSINPRDQNDSIYQDLANVKIYVKGKTTINCDKKIEFKNLTLVTNELIVNSKNNQIIFEKLNLVSSSANMSAGSDINIITNSKIESENIYIYNQNNGINIGDNCEILSEKAKLDNANKPININKSKITSEELEIRSMNSNGRINSSDSDLISNSILIYTHDAGGVFVNSNCIAKQISINLRNTGGFSSSNSIFATDKLTFTGQVNNDGIVNFSAGNTDDQKEIYKKVLKRVGNYLNIK